MDKTPRLAIVVPCYNEEEVLPETHKRLHLLVEQLIHENLIAPSSYMLLVDDGSKDQTWPMISQLHNDDAFVFGLKLSRNRGHQNALLAGLMAAKDMADIAISIDADLQDDTNAIRAMVQKYHEGYEIVYGVRSDRTSDTFFKRTTALMFYRMMQKLGTKTIYNHADYRLMSQRVLNELANYREVNLFLRGIIPLIGYRSTTVEYVRHERFAGQSKYSLKKMLSFALDGITSFSVQPINLIFKLGMFFLILTGLGVVAALTLYFLNIAYPLWEVIILLFIGLMGSFNLLAIATIGTYIGKTYAEVKARPRYAIETLLTHPENPIKTK